MLMVLTSLVNYSTDQRRAEINYELGLWMGVYMLTENLAGPNVNGVDNTVPDNCYVEQAAYVVRHGSRYPDSGAYQQWVTLYEKASIQFKPEA